MEVARVARLYGLGIVPRSGALVSQAQTSGQAVVTLSGKGFYLGPWQSKASRVEYDRLIGEWLAAGRSLPVAETELTIAEMALRYRQCVKGYYVKDGQPTGSLDRVRVALRVLRESHGHTLAKDFGPRALRAVQHTPVRSGRSRRYCNYLAETVKRVFRWAVSQEMLSESVYWALAMAPASGTPTPCDAPTGPPPPPARTFPPAPATAAATPPPTRRSAAPCGSARTSPPSRRRDGNGRPYGVAVMFGDVSAG